MCQVNRGITLACKIKSVRYIRPFVDILYGKLPFSSVFLELFPTVTPVVPLGFLHPCASVSQIDTSYLVKVMPTRTEASGSNSTCVKPFRIEGGSPADGGIFR